MRLAGGTVWMDTATAANLHLHGMEDVRSMTRNNACLHDSFSAYPSIDIGREKTHKIKEERWSQPASQKNGKERNAA